MGALISSTRGVTCSVDHIHRHGHFWSNQCNAIDELDKSKFWCLTRARKRFAIPKHDCSRYTAVDILIAVDILEVPILYNNTRYLLVAKLLHKVA